MITIINGIPGSGKTLMAVSRLREQYKDRQVYYHRIPQLNIPEWKELPDPLTWHELPTGSVIIVDEAHEVFPKRDHRQAEPPHIEAAATLRHRGHDLILITQFPGDLDIFLRRRAGAHYYLKQPITKAKYATVYVWGEYNENFRDEKEQQKADSFQFDYPEDAFTLYKSAETHTKKRYVPKQLKRGLAIAGIGLLLGATAIYYLSTGIFSDIKEPYQAMAAPGATVPTPAPGATSNPYEPTIPGVPWSAPIYVETAKPKTYPKLVCISSRTRCTCYTQQATRLPDVPDEVCRKAATDGVFDFSREDT